MFEGLHISELSRASCAVGSSTPCRLNTEMDLHKLKLLDDHIVVLRNLIGMISQELETATAERQHLMEKMGREERKETGKGSNFQFLQLRMF